MKTISGIENYSPSGKPVYVALGAFDGMHYGHLSLIEKTIKKAAASGGESMLATFDPHPRRFISGDNKIGLINDSEEKIEIISSLGVDTMFVIHFDEKVASMSPDEFVRVFIVEKIKASEVFIGFNFYFGAGRHGNADTLIALGEKYGFKVNVLMPIEIGNFVVSSSKIRLLIEAGAVDDVVKFMGRPYRVSGKVVPGDGLGRRLNIPTANLKLACGSKMAAKAGVYVVKCVIDSKIYGGVMNIGTRPTIYEKDSRLVTFEMHILDFNLDIYSKKVDVYFYKRLRDEKRFVDFKALCEQIREDIKNAREYFEAENLTPLNCNNEVC